MAAKQTRAQLLGAGATALGTFAGSAAAASGEFVEGPFGTDFVGDIFRFELEGMDSGWVSDIEGGQAVADVVTEKIGPDHIAKKHIGNVKYNEFSVQLRVGTNAPLVDWIKASWDKGYARKNGAVVAADFDYKEKARRTFTEALISEVQFPALDAASKDPAYMTVKLAPRATVSVSGAGSIKFPADPAKQKMTWKLGVDGLDTTRVSKIDSFTVKQGIVADSTGNLTTDFPNLSIWLDPAGADSWIEWYDDFLIAGNNDDAKQKNGSLIMLDPTRQKSLLELTFSGLGIFKMTPEKSEANGEKIKRFNVELYCEQMTFKLNSTDG